MAETLPPSSVEVTKSGSLNFPETSGHHRPVMGLLYPFRLIIAVIKTKIWVKLTMNIGINMYHN
jgi:hypothetical protein